MNFEQKNNTGVFFHNEKTKQTQPDFTGNATIEGVKKTISIWKNVSQKTGKEYFSISFQDPFKKEEKKEDLF